MKKFLLSRDVVSELKLIEEMAPLWELRRELGALRRNYQFLVDCSKFPIRADIEVAVEEFFQPAKAIARKLGRPDIATQLIRLETSAVHSKVA